MIIGVGCDIVEVSRVEKAYQKDSFEKKIYTEAEIKFISGRALKAATNFAVKESVAKGFGTGFRGFNPDEIEVLRDELGKPYVNLYGRAKEIADKLGVTKIHVTTSDEKDYAIAMIILEKEEE